MGLPGSGKTTLAVQLSKILDSDHFNADAVRQQYNDWDFSTEGRRRQARRMFSLSEQSTKEYAILDFVCPLNEIQEALGVDFIIWMDTIQQSRFEDTNLVFQAPKKYNLRIRNFDYDVNQIRI